MYPRPFEYVAPGSLEEALRALGSKSEAKVLAGGHSLLPMMKLRIFSPEVLVDIGRIAELYELREVDDHLAVGAMVTHAEVAASELVGAHAPAVAEAAAWLGDPQVRNRGTLCGSLAHGDPASDEPPTVLAVGATLMARSMEGERHIPAEQFFLDTMTTALRDEEILVEVRLPKRGPGEGCAYEKLGRRGGRSDFAVAGAAAWVRLSDGVVTGARVALAGVGPVPALAAGVAEALVGTDGSPEAITSAADRAADGVVVLEDLYGSEEYKAHLARVFTRKAVLRAVERAMEGGLRTHDV